MNIVQTGSKSNSFTVLDLDIDYFIQNVDFLTLTNFNPSEVRSSINNNTDGSIITGDKYFTDRPYQQERPLK